MPKPEWRTLSKEKILHDYKQISDYGIIGDLKTCALVGIDGSIDWFCVPRFDSASVFAAIIDKRRGGCFRILPSYKEFDSRQYYEGFTNILVTQFRAKSGHIKVVDFMPCFKIGGSVVSSGEIHRQVTCTYGRFELDVDLNPKMNYGRETPQITCMKGIGYSFRSREIDTRQELVLITPLKFRISKRNWLSRRLRMKKGHRVELVLRYGGARIHQSEITRSQIKLRETKRYWEDWVKGCKYSGKWRNYVFRSSLILKLLQYSPTSAIVAAPTTSLPEVIGGVRNWDYRYSWIRDSSFVLWAFHSLGHYEEALTYLDWISSIFYLTGENLQVMLGINGERDLAEKSLDYLDGYRGSRPVRVGNGAWDQAQLDIYGILLDAMYFAHKHVGKIDPKMYEYLVKLVANAVEKNWREPDCGIWEVRGERKHFVYSKVWCWVALDRAFKIAKSLGKREDATRWRRLGDRIKREVLRKGWHEEVRSFVRSYDSNVLDSANLLMPQVRFIDGKDPKMVSTIEQTMKKLLVKDKFLYRYLCSDGLPGQEGAFLICSFWLVRCLTLAGMLQEAEKLLESLISHSNHLGLFSEEIEPSDGTMLGNFPQAFTHMGFITAAVGLGRALKKAKRES